MTFILIFILLLSFFLLALLGKKNRLFCISALTTILVGLAIVSITRLDTVYIRGETMGTTYSVTLAVPVYKTYTREFKENLLKAKIDKELERVNALMSTYDPNSELSKLNKHQSTKPFPISADTATVLKLALEIAQKTDGIYDPTVGPLVNLWRFGPEDRPEQIPTDEEIATAQKRIGWNKIQITETTDSKTGQKTFAVVKTQPDIYIDLSSIAKGFGVDCVTELLRQNGYANTLVEIGGELRGMGKNASGKDWSVGVRRPVLMDDNLEVVPLGEKSIATSGDYMNFYEFNGVRYSHIIDTKTGRPITHKTASVSVIDDSCMVADGWATALLAAGAEQGKVMAQANGLTALFIINDNGELVVEKVSVE